MQTVSLAVLNEPDDVPPVCLAEGNEEKEEKKEKRHGRTTDELRELTKSVRDGTYHYDDGKPRRSLDFSTYNETQANELADTLNLIRKFVDRASAHIPERRHRGRGRPPIPTRDVAKALLFQACFGVSDRVAAGLVRLFREKLGISMEFSYKTIERGYDPGPVSELLREVFRLTNEYGNPKETTFAVDGAGEPTSTKVNYESVRSEQRAKEKEQEQEKEPGEEDVVVGGRAVNTASSSATWPPSSTKHDFQYGVSSVGVHTLMYGAFAPISDHSVSEFSRFSSFVAETRINCPSFETALADSLYANRVACEIATRYGVKLYSIPKTNTTFRSHGVPS